MDMGRGSRTNNGYIYTAQQDNGISEKTPTNNWKIACCGDGGGVAVDPTDPAQAIGIDGNDFQSLGWPGPTLPGNIGLVSFDPNGGIAYASVGAQLFLGKSSGSAFLLMHTFPQPLTALNQVKGDPNTIWVGLFDGRVQYTHNALHGATSTWTARTVTGAPSPSQAVSGIAIDPVNTKTVVVVYPGFGCVDSSGSPVPCSSTSAHPPKHVFLTANDGGTWKNRSGTTGGGDNNLPDLPLHAVVIIPSTSPHTIVVGSDAGVMQSADLGKTWQVLGTGLPTAPVTALAFDPDVKPLVLRAATFGRSVFELKGQCPLCPPLPQCTQSGCFGPASWGFGLSCTGVGVGIVFNGGCYDLYGEPRLCYAGFNGSSPVSASWGGLVGPPLWQNMAQQENPQVCTQNAAGEQSCETVTMKVPACPPNSGPPAPPQLCTEQGKRWCDKYDPPRCVSEQDCTVIPTHPNRPTPP